ncbi:lipopolysaccharide biosynthesis protein [Aerococcaceae bacterium DSM 111020]|nr:lipopolysaccharide biosynthesis protein [Aerococcaceae bacterium DSM 111020]
MDSKYGKRNVIINVLWKMLERFSSLLVSLITNVVLSRLLAPKYFGLLAMVNVIAMILTIFVTSGVGNSLIQKKDADQKDFSSVFWANLAVSFVLYFIVYLMAPSISNFYGNSELTLIIRVLCFQIPIASIYSIQSAYVAKNMLYKNFFYTTLSSKILSGLIGVLMALNGFGIWALVFQNLSLLFFETLIMWFRVDWRPSFEFSFKRVKALYPYAIGLMSRSFVEQLSNQLRVFFIGGKYNSSQLGYYDRGNLLPNTIITNLSTSTGAVMFSVMSMSQENIISVLNMCRRWIKLFAFFALPLLLLLSVIGNPLFEILLTEQWLPAVPYLRIACVVYASWTIEVPIREALKSLGYSKLCFNMEVIKTLISILLLLTTLNMGVLMIAISGAVSAIINILVSLYYAKKILEYDYRLFLKDIMPIMLLLCVMGIGLLLFNYVLNISNLYLKVILNSVLGIVIYFVTAFISKNENLIYIVNSIKSR